MASFPASSILAGDFFQFCWIVLIACSNEGRKSKQRKTNARQSHPCESCVHGFDQLQRVTVSLKVRTHVALSAWPRRASKSAKESSQKKVFFSGRSAGVARDVQLTLQLTTQLAL